MKKVKLVKAIFTQEEIAAINTKNIKLEEENKNLKEKLSKITMVSDDEKQSIEHILELEQENKRLSEKNKIYSNALVQEKEEKRIKKIEDIIEHNNVMIDKMYYLILSYELDDKEKLLIIKAVVDYCHGNKLTPRQKRLFDTFWGRDF